MAYVEFFYLFYSINLNWFWFWCIISFWVLQIWVSLFVVGFQIFNFDSVSHSLTSSLYAFLWLCTYKYWEWIKRTDMATRAIQNGNLLINLIHMHTKAPIHHDDHKPTHGLPHTWQIKQYTCTDSHYIVIYNPQSIHGFTQNPQPIHKSTNPRPHWSWLFTKHQSHIQVHPNKPNPYPSPTAKDNNPSPKPNPWPIHGFTKI